MTLPPRPKRDSAAKTVRMHPGGQGWVHDDPADVCSVHLHQLYETAIGCEREATAVMANISERDWQQRVVDLAALFEWSFMHVYPLRRAAGFKTPTTARGWPDLALVKGERLLFVELKSRRGVVSPEQEHWLELLSHPAGCECYVWRPADWPEVVRILTNGRASA